MSKITESARGKTCIRCGGHDAYACHYNGQRQFQYGKGMGTKAHDMATAEFCHACDQIFTEGSTEKWANQDERSEEFLHWILMTNIRRFVSGCLKCY